MTAQTPMQDSTWIQDVGELHSELVKDRLGRQAFTAMYGSWVARSGWSLVNVAELCETALRNTIAAKVPDFASSNYKAGDLVVSDGYVWIALNDVEAAKAPTKKSMKSWGQVCNLKRLYPSQLHNLQMGSIKMPGPTAFDVLGRLNLYLAALRAGTAKPPIDAKLREKAEQAVVIEDADGPFGPEEMFAVYIGRMEPPFSVTKLSEKQAQQKSHEIARQIRAGMRACDLDLIDSWSKFIEGYPTRDAQRTAKVGDVAMGQGVWSAEQVEDEEAAVSIALVKMIKAHKPGEAESG